MKETIKEILKFVIIAAIIIIPIRTYIAKPFIVKGASMDPTFASGQYLLVDEISYRFEEPKRGDIVVFKYPKDEKVDFIKRIIGLPGDEVLVKGQNVSIKNASSTIEIKLNEPYVIYNNDSDTDTVLGRDQYFVMGDNRANSLDSRAWGPVSKDLIIGRVFLRLLPIDKISVFPGAYTN
ncbi:signal peptidase I [Candidatus Nomurabacteria bacterium]|nr:signal peptidase I [Candidatus Nomurabacteria bacterium]